MKPAANGWEGMKMAKIAKRNDWISWIIWAALVLAVLSLLGWAFGAGCSGCGADDDTRFGVATSSPDALGGKDNPYGSPRQPAPPGAKPTVWDRVYYPGAAAGDSAKGGAHAVFDTGVLLLLVFVAMVVGLVALPGWSKVIPGVVLLAICLALIHAWLGG